MAKNRQKIRDVKTRGQARPGSGEEMFLGVQLLLLDRQDPGLAVVMHHANPKLPPGTVLLDVDNDLLLPNGTWLPLRLNDVSKAIQAVDAIRCKSCDLLVQLQAATPLDTREIQKVEQRLALAEQRLLLLKRTRDKSLSHMDYLVQNMWPDVPKLIVTLRRRAIVRPYRAWMLLQARLLELNERDKAQAASRAALARYLLQSAVDSISTKQPNRVETTRENILRFQSTYLEFALFWDKERRVGLENLLHGAMLLLTRDNRKVGRPREIINEAAQIFDELAEEALARYTS